jgi:hypothetical protein
MDNGAWAICAKKLNFHLNALKICKLICFKLVIVFNMLFFIFFQFFDLLSVDVSSLFLIW